MQALLLSLSPIAWLPVRVPQVLKEGGFEVIVICFKNSFISASSFVKTFLYVTNEQNPQSLLRQAILQYSPTVVFPLDHSAVQVWYDFASGNNEAQKFVGNLNNLSSRWDKWDLYLAFKDNLEGMFPKQKKINEQDNIDVNQFPLVLKLSNGCGGDSVVVCKHQAEAYESFQYLAKKRKKTETLFQQEFIGGDRIMLSTVSVEGELIDWIAVKGENIVQNLPATHLKKTSVSAKTLNGVRLMLESWKYTGMAEFEMMHCNETEWLLEVNPRPTHYFFARLLGHHFGRALWSKLANTKLVHSPPLINPSSMVICANILLEKFTSVMNLDGFIDLPFEDDRLMLYLINKVFLFKWGPEEYSSHLPIIMQKMDTLKIFEPAGDD